MDQQQEMHVSYAGGSVAKTQPHVILDEAFTALKKTASELLKGF